ncbi:hypothetical protein PAPYR_5880 [Paratrimastix pyriformis]|uniref:Uncharacterized protein n=1 Tax=Paratrimastix pyriformis TaxID=342808 RepID=A0ABQ8UGF7_9EUKA|nr:hypothetical protein PAPYR_5880 [Paratrimastix pyriformis]
MSSDCESEGDEGLKTMLPQPEFVPCEPTPPYQHRSPSPPRSSLGHLPRPQSAISSSRSSSPSLFLRPTWRPAASVGGSVACSSWDVAARLEEIRRPRSALIRARPYSNSSPMLSPALPLGSTAQMGATGVSTRPPHQPPASCTPQPPSHPRPATTQRPARPHSSTGLGRRTAMWPSPQTRPFFDTVSLLRKQQSGLDERSLVVPAGTSGGGVRAAIKLGLVEEGFIGEAGRQQVEKKAGREESTPSARMLKEQLLQVLGVHSVGCVRAGVLEF